jgi:hypothetical protein
MHPMPHVNMRPGPMAAAARGVSHDYDTKLAAHSSWRKLMPLAPRRLPELCRPLGLELAREVGRSVPSGWPECESAMCLTSTSKVTQEHVPYIVRCRSCLPPVSPDGAGGLGDVPNDKSIDRTQG